MSILMKLSLRNLFLYSLISLLAIASLYKYFEWKTFSDLSSAYNDSYFNEIKFVSGIDPSYTAFFSELYNNKQFQNPKDSTDYLQGLTAIENKLNIVINNDEGYRDLLNNNNDLFSKLGNSTNFLFGKRGDIGKKIVNDQLKYYQDEIKSNNINLAYGYGIKILFTIYRDNVAFNDFGKIIGSSTDPTYISKYFANIASLEKYSNSDFKFDKEDFIKNYYPNFVSKVNHWKKYFATYYQAEKDFSVGNTDTAQLELQTVSDNASNSYIDYSSIFNEQNSTTSDLSKDILKQVSDQAATIKDYKSKGLYKYPLLRDIKIWKEDFVLCQMYDYKSSVFYSITSNYPVSKNVSDLIKELSAINPKTDNVDSKFDKSTMKFTNSDKSLEFTCTDKYTGEKLKFVTPKSY